MSMFTRKMRMLTAVIMDDSREAVVKALIEKGAMEFVHIDSIPSDKLKMLSSHTSAVPKAVLSDTRARIEGFLRQGGIAIPELTSKDMEESKAVQIDAITTDLDRMSASLQQIRDKQKIVNQKLLSLEELDEHCKSKDKDNNYLDLRVGSITSGKIDDLKDRLSQIGGIFLFDKLPYVTLCLRRDSSRLSDIVDKFGWTENPDPIIQDDAKKRALSSLSSQIRDCKNQLKALSDDCISKIQSKQQVLIDMWKKVRANELCEHVESFFSYTNNTTLFSGWVSEEDSQSVESIIYSITKGKCIIEWTEASDVSIESVPVEIKSPKILAPFEHIVENYGTPEYGSINPTPFTTVAYILMFMLMFADLGQGFILLLIGLLGGYIYKKNPTKKDGLISRYLCSLLLYLGPASMVGGLLFGSCFGYSLFPPLWFNYHAVVNGHVSSGSITSIYDILGITIWFGIAVISTGLILNWINLLRKKRFIELVCSRNGFVGGMLFALGIWFGYGFVKSGYKTFPSSPFLMPVLILGIVIILIQVPLEYIVERKYGGEKKSIGSLIMDTIMEFLVEALEIFSGFLSNTLSFMRVAGLGIAHVSLMTAFSDMSDLTSNMIFKILIMIAGNILVIALEGLSAGIQSLRLNYYEFFTKYFTGRGIAFEPVGLGKNKTK